MGKHDKAITEFKWEPMPDEYYKARIKTLEKENITLQQAYDKDVEAYESSEEMHKAVIAELKQMVNELIEENEKLKAAIIREVTR